MEKAKRNNQAGHSPKVQGSKGLWASIKILWTEHIWPILAVGIVLGLIVCACIFAVFRTSSAGIFLLASTAGSFTTMPVLAGIMTYYLQRRDEKEASHTTQTPSS